MTVRDMLSSSRLEPSLDWSKWLDVGDISLFSTLAIEFRIFAGLESFGTGASPGQLPVFVTKRERLMHIGFNCRKVCCDAKLTASYRSLLKFLIIFLFLSLFQRQ